MKYIITTVFLFIFLTVSEATQRENFYGIRYDYTLHYQTGMVSAIVLDQWNKGPFDIGEDYGLISIGVPILLGFAKEYVDFKSNDERIAEDARHDMIATVFGALTGKFLSITF